MDPEEITQYESDQNLERKFAQAINAKSAEGRYGNTPDFILASLATASLETFALCLAWREGWYGWRHSDPGASKTAAEAAKAFHDAGQFLRALEVVPENLANVMDEFADWAESCIPDECRPLCPECGGDGWCAEGEWPPEQRQCETCRLAADCEAYVGEK